MAGSTGVHLEGVQETIRSLKKLGVEVKDFKAVFRKIGQNVVNDASGRVPRRSGRLAASIRPSNTQNKAVVRAGSARVPYAGVINYGWPRRGIAGTGFLTDAANSKGQESAQMLDDELRKIITKYGLK